jgi:hypothetical protein
MVVRVHGGIIDDQMLTGSLRYFDITDAGGLGTNVIADGNQRANLAQVAAEGSGYAINDVLTVVGGTGTAATFTVTRIGAGGEVEAASFTTGGDYSVIPTNPVATTVAPAGGSGCTLNLTYTSLLIIPGATGTTPDGSEYYIGVNKPVPDSAADQALQEIAKYATIVQVGIVSANVIRIACENTGFGWDQPGGGDAAADMQTAIQALSTVTVPDNTSNGATFDFAGATVVESTFAAL